MLRHRNLLRLLSSTPIFVTPAQAGVQLIRGNKSGIPASAGMTEKAKRIRIVSNQVV